MAVSLRMHSFTIKPTVTEQTEGHESCPSFNTQAPPSTPRITPPTPHPRPRIDRDPMRMPRELVPLAPSIDPMPAPLQLRDGLARKACLDVQRVARLAERKADREPARSSC